MMSMPRQFQLCIGILSLWVIAPTPLVVVAEPLVIETPTILEKIRVASTSQLWNGVDGTVFHRLGGSTEVLSNDLSARVTLPLTSPIASQPNGGFVGRREPMRIATRCNPDGSIDLTFVTAEANQQDISITDMAAQPDGKVLVGCLPPLAVSAFQGLNDGLFRLMADGSHDTSFRSAIRPTAVKTVVLLSDGKILANTFSRLVRLTQEGDVDSTFHQPLFSIGNCTDVGLQPDGKIIVGGDFDQVDSVPRAGLARLNQNGTLDFLFRPSGLSGPGGVDRFEVQSDGSIIITAGRTILRFYADGSLDQQFTTVVNDPNLSSVQIAIDRDDRVYFNDGKTIFQKSGRNRIRIPAADVPLVLQQSGSVDGTWAPLTSIPANTASDYLLPNTLGPANGFFRTVPAQ